MTLAGAVRTSFYIHHGKKTTRFIRAEHLPEVRRLVDQWVTLSLEKAELQRQLLADPPA